jgi:TRAP-type mannitol/chloroaromatic compound transport system permease small subunit
MAAPPPYANLGAPHSRDGAAGVSVPGSGVAQRLIDGIDAFVDTVGRIASWLILAIVATLFLQIPMREFVRYGHREVNDIGQVIHATVFMIGVAYAMRWDAHVRVDIFRQHMGSRTRAAIDLIGTLLFLAPWLAIVTRSSIPIVLRSWAELEQFADTFTPGYFLLKTQLLSFCLLVALQAFANVLRNLTTMLQRPA